jgi:pSer/pThr/pTyr-binding forkhead associated (FHA) protein
MEFRRDKGGLGRGTLFLQGSSVPRHLLSEMDGPGRTGRFMPAILKLIDGKESGRTYTVEENSYKIFGRSPSADVILDDTSVSRHHMMVSFKSGSLRVTDLESSNGTFLNGVKVREQELKSGDVILIGTHRFVVQLAGIPGLQKPSTEEPESKRIAFCTRCHRAIPFDIFPGGQLPCESSKLLCSRCAGGGTPVPSVIKNFRLLSKLRDDILGPVYKAEQEGLGRIVAVKIISPKRPLEEKTIKEFMREAKIGGQLFHPNIVEMIDAGSSDEIFYITYEYIEGISLQEMIQRQGQVSQEWVFYIALNVSTALDFAFQKKIIHRNVNPVTILISNTGEVRLADFGLAKSLEDAGLSGITQVGEQKGTAAYMPPEQFVDASQVDQRADLYALGCTCYHALTGRQPFEAHTLPQIMKRVADGQYTPIRQWNPRVHSSFVKVIEAAMSRDLTNRYQTPGEMLAALKKIESKVLPKR